MELRGFLPAQNHLAEEAEDAEEDKEAEHLGGVGKALGSDGERCLAAAVRDGDDDDAGEQDADDGLTDDEPRGEERTAPQPRRLSVRAAAFAEMTMTPASRTPTMDSPTISPEAKSVPRLRPAASAFEPPLLRRRRLRKYPRSAPTTSGVWMTGGR